MRELLHRFIDWLRRDRLDRELAEELRFHREQAERDARAGGATAGEARWIARRRFGNATAAAEAARDRWSLPWLDHLHQDLRYALRTLRGAPGFSATVILTLAIGIGANTAIFSILRTVLLAPLPYPESEQLVVASGSAWTPAGIAMAFRDLPGTFQDVAAYSPEPVAVTGGDQPSQLQGSGVTPNFFHLLGATMALGRDFTPADAAPGATPSAIISHGLWTTRFGGRSDILGHVIHVNDQPRRIIGILRQGFHLVGPRAEDPQVWTPLELRLRDGRGRLLWVIPVARLGAGIPLARAQSAVDRALPLFVDAHPELGDADRWRVRLATIKSEVVKDVRDALVVLQLTAAALLLIACVNVANLLLARASARQGEVAVRSALGASRGRLVQQLMTENVVLALLGGAAGVLLMRLTLGAIVRAAPAGVPRLDEVGAHLPVFAVAVALAVVTGVLFGVVPTVVAVRGPLHDFLKEGGRARMRSSRQHRISQGLVVAEVTLTLMLLVGAGLLMRSFFRLSDQPVGFRTRDVVTVPIQIPPARYDSLRQLDAFYTAALERLRTVPGVEFAALANNLPISRGNARRQYLLEGEVERPETGRAAQYGVVSAEYFRTLEIPLVRGRFFDAGDRRGGLKVAIIDEAMARQAFPGQDPIRKRFRFDGGRDGWLTVVGVVADTRGAGLASDASAGFYIPYTQRPGTIAEMAVGHIAVFLVRSSTPIAALATPLRGAIWAVNPQQPITSLIPLADAVAQGAAPHRFRATLLGTFAGIALALVLVGIYGVIEYAVSERSQEFGIRMALGATPGIVLRDVLRWGLRLTATGALLGLVGVVLSTRLLAGMLFGVTPTDPATLAVALAVIGAVTIAACAIPARRATRVDAMVALRADRFAGRP